VGGIGGFVRGTVKNSYSTGNITSSDVYQSLAGGIAGYVDGNIENSYSTGNITSSASDDSYAGGIAGKVDGNIENSYSTGNITSSSSGAYQSYVGGIVGYVNGTIENCAAINPIITTGGYIGRVFGYLYSSGSFINNFANSGMLLNGATTNIDNDENGTGRTLSLFRNRTIYETDLGWEFGDDSDHPWTMPQPDGSGYPLLYWQTD
jgi:hypothetical protein